MKYRGQLYSIVYGQATPPTIGQKTAVLTVGVVAYYLLKIKKVASKEEQFDYSRFERRDSLEYVRFQNIINAVENKVQTKNGLIVADDGYRYIAGLKVNGYNFFSASAQEQVQSMKGMLAFLNTIEGDVQYRQSTKAIDLSDNINEHKKRLKEVALEIEGLKLDHQELVEQADQFLDNPEVYENYDKKLNEVERTIKCKQHTAQELDVVTQYMEALSGTNIESEKVQCWFFEWAYNSNDYTTELTDEERYEVAAEALTTKANGYISALSRTGCTCERMTGEEILELFRYHYSPITADAYSITDLYNSSVNALYVSSDSLSTLEQEAQDEAEYYKVVNQMREEEYAQETVAQLEEELDDVFDSTEEELFISNEGISRGKELSKEVLTNETKDTNEDVVSVSKNATEASENANEEDAESVIFNFTEDEDEEEDNEGLSFEFAPDDEEDDDSLTFIDDVDDDEPLVIEDSTESNDLAVKEPVFEKTTKAEKKAKKDKKKTKDSEPQEGQMNIFDSVPFGEF